MHLRLTFEAAAIEVETQDSAVLELATKLLRRLAGEPEEKADDRDGHGPLGFRPPQPAEAAGDGR